jgi:hypothetical protein
MELADLQSRFAASQQEPTRLPASTPPPAAVAPESVDAFASLHRAAILKVIDDERAEQERKKEEERKQREIEQARQHAERTAAKVPLSDGQKLLLAQFYEDDRAKMDELRSQMRDPADAAGTAPRDAFRELREWHTNELTRLFGTDLGAQIDQADQDRRPGQGLQNGQRGRRVGGGPTGSQGQGGQGQSGAGQSGQGQSGQGGF